MTGATEARTSPAECPSCGGVLPCEGRSPRAAPPAENATTAACPPAPAEDALPPNGDARVDAVPPGHARPRVLVVDDEANLRRLLRRHFERRGWDVDECHDGLDALNRLASPVRPPAYQMILSDIRMPKMTGIELYAQVAIRHPALVARLVFMSGNRDDAEIEAFLRTISRPSLEKPFHLPALVDLMDSFAGV